MVLTPGLSYQELPCCACDHANATLDRTWETVTARLQPSALPAVYAPDLLGFGASHKPSDLTYDPHLWCEQVAAFVSEVVQEPCVLVGNSIGSQVLRPSVGPFLALLLPRVASCTPARPAISNLARRCGILEASILFKQHLPPLKVWYRQIALILPQRLTFDIIYLSTAREALGLPCRVAGFAL